MNIILLGVIYIAFFFYFSYLVGFFLKFVYDFVLFQWYLGVERNTAGYVLFVVETVHQLVGRPSLWISQLYRTVPSVFECKRTDDTTKKRSYPKYLCIEIREGLCHVQKAIIHFLYVCLLNYLGTRIYFDI